MRRKVLGVIGAIFVVYASVFLGAFAGMDQGVSNPRIQFNTFSGEQAGWKVGELIGLAIGIVLALIIIKIAFKKND